MQYTRMHARFLCLRMLVTITTERRGNVVYILSYFGGLSFFSSQFPTRNSQIINNVVL
jgi:hypothetical protein